MGDGVLSVSEFELLCKNPGETTINLVFGNGMDLFMKSSLDGQPSQQSKQAFRFDKLIVITVASS